MKLLLATNNAHKVQELKAILGDYFTELSTLKEALEKPNFKFYKTKRPFG